jgi:glutathione S-transferase
MITVHHLNESRSQRILWLLEELGLTYEIRPYFREERTKMAPPEMRDIHPLGKSPIISDDGRVIAESGAIIDYLIRRHGEGRLEPDRATDAYDEYVHWLHYAEGSAVVPFIVQPIANAYGRLSSPLRRRVAAELDLHLSYINASLDGRHFLLGEELTGADVQMSFVGELAGSKADRKAYPNIDDWIRRLQARPAYQAAIERGGPYELGRS